MFRVYQLIFLRDILNWFSKSAKKLKDNFPEKKSVRIFLLLKTMTTVVDSVEECKRIVGRLLTEERVAMDIEGIDLSRTGAICLLQIGIVHSTASGAGSSLVGAASASAAGPNTHVYLFDITVMGAPAFSEGRLKELLESTGVQKVCYDIRNDADALQSQFNVRLSGAYDLQILYTNRFSDLTDRYLKGLKVALKRYKYMPEEDIIKERGFRLFGTRHGNCGDPIVWQQRPLRQELIAYAGCDVKHLLPMRTLWGNSEKINRAVLEQTEKRIANTLRRAVPVQGRQAALRDFDIVR